MKVGVPDNGIVVHTKAVVDAASLLLNGLATPNEPGLTTEHHDLIDELKRSVRALEQEFADVKGKNEHASDEVEIRQTVQILKIIRVGLPVWRQTWLTFIGPTAEPVATLYMAGFIAGVLHDSFSPSADRLI